jgi:hypothetical protein
MKFEPDTGSILAVKFGHPSFKTGASNFSVFLLSCLKAVGVTNLSQQC